MYIAEKEIGEALALHYDLHGSLEPLNGYDEQNLLLTSGNNERYICKISTPEHDRYFLDAQVAITDHLQASPVAAYFQRHIRNRQNEPVTHLEIAGREYYLRVLNYLEGDFMVDLPDHEPALLESIGTVLGKMDASLAGFRHHGMHRHYEWDISNAADVNQFIPSIKNHEQRRIAGYFLLQFEAEVLPVLHKLRKAYIHNDANDYNVLVKNGTISGLIDFGDMVYAPLINNVAVACTYAMLGKEDPVSAAIHVTAAYHQQHALKPAETDLLYYLVAARLCISVCRSAYKRETESENEHHYITERPAWQLLEKLVAINPLRMQHALREACGMEGLISTATNHNDLLEQRKLHIGRNLSISYKKKLKIVRGALQYLYDDEGNTYVDCVNNVSHVGHCHPSVVRATQKQVAILNTNTRYLNDHLVDYAKMLTATLPAKLRVCYFTNSGSEANDLAIRMSRHFTGQKDVIVLDHAYHGTSTTAIEMSPYKFDGKGGFGRMQYIHKAMNPDGYRGPFRSSDPEAGHKYATDIARIVESLKQAGKSPAAFICETLLGVGGQIPLPDGYLKAVYEHVRSAGGLCIADEVQVGFGRVGEKFWGFELQDVEPDIVVLGKPIGNGHPLAAVVVTDEIADAFNNGMEYFNTYGGNPVSMATGKAVLQAIQGEEMQAHALQTGNLLMEALRRLAPRHPLIGDVRGMGLFVGIELVRDRQTLEPAVPEIDMIVERMKDRGFLLSTDGPLHNVLKIKPPLVFNEKNATDMVAALDETFTELSAGKI